MKICWKRGLFAAFLLLTPLPRLHAATLTVANLHDSGEGSLRQAIADAHPGDTISITSGATIKLNSELLINKTLSIIGASHQTHSTLDGQYKNRVLQITGPSVTLDNIDVIQGNADSDASGSYGGGILIQSGSNLSLNYCDLFRNTAHLGGAISNQGTIQATETTMGDNVGVSGGGGMFGANGTFRNCTFYNNMSYDGGGGVDNPNVAINTFDQCFFLNNIAVKGPAGFGAAAFRNCTLTGNKNFPTQGNNTGISKVAGQTVTMTNTIIANVLRNAASNGAPNCNAPITSGGYNLSDDASCFNGQSPSTDLVNKYPSLEESSIRAPTGYGIKANFLMTAYSPALDAGNPTCCTDAQGQPLTTDAFGFRRIRDGNRDHTTRVDIGAVELQPTLNTWTVSPQASAACSAQVYTCNKIQSAVDAAYEFDTVNIQAGSYPEAVTLPRELILRGVGRVAVTGKTGGGGRVVTVGSGVVASVENLTISHPKTLNPLNGGGVSNSGNLTLKRCTISGNAAPQNGGAILNSGTLAMENCTVASNRAEFSGGGIYNTGTVTIRFCTFWKNTAINAGTVDQPGGDSTNQPTFDNHGGLFFQNTIIGNSPGIRNCNSTVTSQGHNLMTDGSCGTNASDLRNADPQLGPLQDNGGDTFTVGFPATSPARNAGDGSAVGANDTDQRGVSRVYYGAVDIGATEMYWPGDFDGNGLVDASDVSQILHYYVNNNAAGLPFVFADVRPKPGTGGRPYGDQLIKADDVNWVLRRFLGLETAP